MQAMQDHPGEPPSHEINRYDTYFGELMKKVAKWII